MKKNFVKKLALAMALTLAVGSVPSMNVEAAAAPDFKSTQVNLKVGQTKKYNTVNSTKKSVKFVIGNKKIATVDYKKGNKYCHITGVAAGKTRVRAEFKDYKTKDVIIKKMPVVVKETVAELASVKQTAANAFEATFTTDASKTFTAESFTKIESTDGIFSAYVKSVEFSTDGKSAKVTTFGNFVDKAVYNVTCGDKTASFTASVGAVANAVINTVQAQANVATDVDFTLYDANGIDVTSAVDVNTYVTLSVEGDYSDVNFDAAADAKITLDTVGNTATVTLTYDPLTADGQIVTTTGTIVCVPTQATVGATTYFTSGGDTAPKIYLNSFAETTTLYDGENGKEFYFTALDKNGDAIVYDNYEVESSNENIITVNTETFDGKFARFEVAPQGAGVAKVVIKATKNEVETLYAGVVTVKAERKLTSIDLSKSSLTISNIAEHDNDYVTVTLKDQYGKALGSEYATWVAEQYNGNGQLTVTSDGDDLKVKVSDFTKEDLGGSYVVEIKADDGDKTLTKRVGITVREANENATENYKVELDNKTLNMDPEDMNKSLVVRLAKYYGTVFAGYVDGSDVEDLNVYVKKGANYFKSDDLTDKTNVQTATAAAIVLDADNKDAGTLTTVTTGAITLVEGKGIAANGTYTVIAEGKFGNDDKLSKKTATFTVKNTMEMPTVTVVATTGEGSGLTLVQNCVKVDVDVLAPEDTTSVIGAETKDGAVANDASRFVTKYILVQDTFGTDTVTYYVPVSKTFKTK